MTAISRPHWTRARPTRYKEPMPVSVSWITPTQDPDSIRDYDAHVYFKETQRREARALLTKFLLKFRFDDIFVSDLTEGPLGPHPLAMFQVYFRARHLPDVLLWFEREHGPLSVLVHKVTGKDTKDHSDHAIWIGSPVSLDFTVFDT